MRVICKGYIDQVPRVKGSMIEGRMEVKRFQHNIIRFEELECIQENSKGKNYVK